MQSLQSRVHILHALWKKCEIGVDNATFTWYNDSGHGDGQGVFIRELKKKLKHNKLDIPVIGVADHKQNEAIEWLEKKQILS